MVTASSLLNTWSVVNPSLTSPNKPRRVKRYAGMAFASVGSSENPCLGIKVTQGQGNLPKVILTSSHGSEAELYLFGGCVTSWKVANKDFLFVRPDAVFNGQKPISGGIPHCFPQFGPGLMQQHGFARNMNWSIVNSENVEGNPIITLELKDGPYSRSMWDHTFQVLYKVTLDKRTLSTELKVTNADQKPFSFTTALHTYFSIFVLEKLQMSNQSRGTVEFPLLREHVVNHVCCKKKTDGQWVWKVLGDNFCSGDTNAYLNPVCITGKWVFIISDIICHSALLAFLNVEDM
ncbi:putative glucose-6-phosphate 1-epimerase [Coffea eugenioides]|uniref:putative glucose-6-phosphate 1-epimerase n=1 Tax=Coffea eugenioides TaxID=49369 RepID=UPI000F60B2FA|nr:putative glucose-6-phosphate 1-epimerase [Coffea eugenioides]